MSIEKFDLDIEKAIKHWIDTSDEDYKTMLALFETKSYSRDLFLGHLSTEKLLKAYYVRRFKKYAPFTYNLYRLAELNEIELTDEYSDWLDNITSFNMNARYDDYKREFFLLCTADYTSEWVEKFKILRTWIKQML